jgi:hypothetical protein
LEISTVYIQIFIYYDIARLEENLETEDGDRHHFASLAGTSFGAGHLHIAG